MFSCDPSDITGGDDNGNGGNGGKDDVVAQNIGGTMSENTTLKDLGLPIDYIVDGMLTLDGNAMVTIEPGVCIAFQGSDGGIKVGENAGISMVGTAEKPIVLRGPINNNNPGSWKWVDVYSTRSDNRMEYVQFMNGGSDVNWSPIIVESGARLSMKHCTIDGSLGYGAIAYYDGSFTAFENNTIKNIKSTPLWIGTLSKNKLGQGNVFKDNKQNYILLAEIGEGESTMTYQGIPWQDETGRGLSVPNNSTLTIEPGVTLRMSYDQQIDVCETAKFYAKGTAEAPIVICGQDEGPGQWGFIDVMTKKACELENVIIDQPGSNEFGGGIWYSYEYTLSLKNVTIRNSDAAGIKMDVETKWDEATESDVYLKPGKFTYENVIFENCKKGNLDINDQPYEAFPW